MKKLFTLLAILAFASSSAFAAFTPQQLTLSGPGFVHYNFDGSDLDIPVTQTGTSATVVLVITTNGKSDQILDIQNGNLGWHYVNKIDTTIYISPVTTQSTGTYNLSWDGMGEGETLAPADNYTYYVWGYDHSKAREVAIKATGVDWMIGFNQIVTKDEQGVTLAQPIFFEHGNSPNNGKALSTPDIYRFTKWQLGTEPDDTALVETTFALSHCNELEATLDPSNYSYFMQEDFTDDGTFHFKRFQWVPGAMAVQDMAWGADGTGESTWNDGATAATIGGISDAGNGYLVAPRACTSFPTTCDRSDIVFIDPETGDFMKSFDITRFHVYFSEGHGDFVSRAPTNFDVKGDRMYMHRNYGIPMTMVDPNAETNDDFIIWHNKAGDYFHDNYTEAPNRTVGIFQYTYHGSMNIDGFVSSSCYDLGTVSFDLAAPDGTGIGYFNFLNEVAGGTNGIEYIDYGSAYDGMYSDFRGQGGVWYTASDSFKGVITPEVIVDSAAPASYTVAQNTPNPFNPTTTISFNLAKAGKTTVDIYNVAGQKVDTLVNGSMSAGNHSVVWNAAKFSAGVYFYTVKSGSFSKTMKMTLVK